MFQSPSLRGSGRFSPSGGDARDAGTSFNPLHCGAVVASGGGGRGLRGRPPRFNPLHCGAVVASGGGVASASRAAFQSPSLRGSGRFLPPSRRRASAGEGFQSPSLRGSGRFQRKLDKVRADAEGFNPLHCGAVVASRPLAARRGAIKGEFQSPSLRGSGRFRETRSRWFSASASQSPSLRGSGRFQRPSPSPRRRPKSLNPLHCGAVVASFLSAGRTRANPSLVSIPFIAGQWSLRRGGNPYGRGGEGLNPLHCGAVVASEGRRRPRGSAGRGLNPLHCGAVVASAAEQARREAQARRSQSPSLRGSGRFIRIIFLNAHLAASLNPLHCGAVVASASERDLVNALRKVSIPFIAGQWSLPPDRRCGTRGRSVSIPFIAGQWSLLLEKGETVWMRIHVSIPFIAGQWSLLSELGDPPTRRRFRGGQNRRVTCMLFP